jgi:imidazolonepropionase-like amidohydrolase
LLVILVWSQNRCRLESLHGLTAPIILPKDIFVMKNQFSPSRILLLQAAALLGLCSMLTFSVLAQSNPSPGKPQTKPIWITGAIIHDAVNPPYTGVIGFDKGEITYVGRGTEIRLDATNSEIIDARGQHVYPGFIALHTLLGLYEIESVRATRDHTESGTLNPHVHALIAYNSDSRIVPTVRNHGVLLAQIAPEGGLISGRSAVVQLDAWNWEDACVKAADGMYVQWPSMSNSTGPRAPSAEEQNKARNLTLGSLENYLNEARDYHLQSPSNDPSGNQRPINLKLASASGLWNGQTKVFVRVGDAKGMVAAVEFFARWDLKPVLVGAEEADQIQDWLATQKIDLILSKVHRLPNREGDPVYSAYDAPARLARAGVRFGFSMDGAWNQRNLPYQAGHAVGFGLDTLRALQALTLDAARILGIDQRYGSLEVGKSATLFLSAGDALDMRGNNPTHAFVDGRRVNLDDKQKVLYRKFSEKYELPAR